MDYDKDSCYNVPAIDQNGNVDQGLDPSNGSNGCRDLNRLNAAQSYSRGRCNHGWCVYVYAYYFEKDVGTGGHRYDWEHIAVWSSYTQRDGNGYPSIKHVGVSQHGNFDKRPVGNVRMHKAIKGSHPKVVYHKDGTFTHDFRLANADDDAVENDFGHWNIDWLLSVWQLNVAIRDKLAGNDWGKAWYELSDWSFAGVIEKSRPSEVPGSLDWSKNDPNCSARMDKDGFC
ncbi:NPP1-domain-containing protein [Sarocladium strictum]